MRDNFSGLGSVSFIQKIIEIDKIEIIPDMASNVLRGKHFKAKEIMTPKPKTMFADDLAINGVSFLKENKINHIVLSDNDKPTGMVHIQDLIREGVL